MPAVAASAEVVSSTLVETGKTLFLKHTSLALAVACLLIHCLREGELNEKKYASKGT